jgi:hypothetical protein
VSAEVKAALPGVYAAAAEVKAAIPTAQDVAAAVKAAVPTVQAVAAEVKAALPTAQAVAVEVKAVVPTAQDVAAEVKAALPTAQAVAAEVKAVVPTAQDVAAEVKAALPTVQAVAAEVKATMPKPADDATVAALVMRHAAPYLKTLAISAVIIVAVVVGMGSVVALSCRSAAPFSAVLTSLVEHAARGDRGSSWSWGVPIGDQAVGEDMGGRKTGRPVPREALPGQAVAPCRGSAVTLHGSCWLPVRADAPCPSDLFQEGDQCYAPIPATPKTPLGWSPQHWEGQPSDVPGRGF